LAGSLRAVEGRPGTWQLRVYLGRDAEGRVRHRHVTFKGSRRQAERELARLVAEQDSQPTAVPEQPANWGPATTVNDAVAAWRDNGWDDLSPRTARHYEGIWRVHIEEDPGRIKRVGKSGDEVSLIDYNHSGVPLVEIVSAPDMSSPAEARDFVAELLVELRHLVGLSASGRPPIGRRHNRGAAQRIAGLAATSGMSTPSPSAGGGARR